MEFIYRMLKEILNVELLYHLTKAATHKTSNKWEIGRQKKDNPCFNIIFDILSLLVKIKGILMRDYSINSNHCSA